MKKASLNFLLSLMLAALFIYGMALFSYKLTQPFFKDTSYSDDVKKFGEFLSSDIDSSSISITFPSNSKKTLLLAYDGCSVLNEIREYYNNIPSSSKFYYCFYDEGYKNLKCGYYDAFDVSVHPRKIYPDGSYEDISPKGFFKNYENNDPCFLLPGEDGSIYTFSLKKEDNKVVISVSKTK